MTRATELDDPEDLLDETSSSSSYSETREISLLDAVAPPVAYKQTGVGARIKPLGGYSTFAEDAQLWYDRTANPIIICMSRSNIACDLQRHLQRSIPRR